MQDVGLLGNELGLNLGTHVRDENHMCLSNNSRQRHEMQAKKRKAKL